MACVIAAGPGGASAVVPSFTVSPGLWSMGLAETPALPLLPLPRYLNLSLPRLLRQGSAAEMDGEAEHSPPDKLIYGASFSFRRSGGPQVLRSENTGDGRCPGPDGHTPSPL